MTCTIIDYEVYILQLLYLYIAETTNWAIQVVYIFAL